MRILMVSIPSMHFFRWTDQLKDSGHEVLWFDINGAGQKANRINWVHQIVDWRLKYDYPGRYLLKNKVPRLYQWLQQFNEKNLKEEFEKQLLEIQPDIVHCFALYVSCAPIVEVMKKYKSIKWVYSAWGNDLFYYQNNPKRLLEIKEVLPKIDYMFADCHRDYLIAKKYGFTGCFLGVYPGGGGYDFAVYDKFIIPSVNRNLIIIKGYEHHFGRCNDVLRAIESLKEFLVDYEIVVFGANQKVISFSDSININSWKNFKVYKNLAHEEILKLMGQSLIYIGNSISDGMPNTLLEAIIMGVFPIQSNPGGATAEIIQNKINGMLIENPEDFIEIKNLILEVLQHKSILNNGINYNLKNVKSTLEYNSIKNEVLKKYNIIESNFI